MRYNIDYDVIVVGGGHAGTEAVSASARMGCRSLLITLNTDNLGEMSCNPAIGGLAKGHLVKEIDALGGVMARAADFGGIQFKRLNSSKGPAVRSSRAQEDRKKYKQYINDFLHQQNNLTIIEVEVQSLLYENYNITGVLLEGDTSINAGAVILTPGTFLNGIMHIGLKSHTGGRIGEDSSIKLADSIKNAGFNMLRFKTGTCARLDGKTINYESLIRQDGDINPVPFSIMTTKVIKKQLPCYITYTNEKTHDIIRTGFDRSPVYTGIIEGTGVRYCPSIEDKIVKFAHMDRHHVFLEPEGLDTDIYYPNGISTSLPEDIQDSFIRTIPGLENVRIEKYGYGIEYDIVDPIELYSTMESKKIKGLYLAGQINGTTGYEEAASQGLAAGINAAGKIKGLEPFILERHESYIGVLLDDLVTKGTREPYRMFTSRAEYRLFLREDNAHLRLTEKGYKYGSVEEDLYQRVDEFRNELEKGRRITEKEYIAHDSSVGKNLGLNSNITLKTALKRPQVNIFDLTDAYTSLKELPDDVLSSLDIEIKYEGYLKRQQIDIDNLKKIEKWQINEKINYSNIKGLSNEIIEKLSMVKPRTLGQASRISGVTPAAISNIMIFLKANYS